MPRQVKNLASLGHAEGEPEPLRECQKESRLGRPERAQLRRY